MKMSNNLEAIIKKTNIAVGEVEQVFEKIYEKVENTDYANKLKKLFLFALKNDISLFPAKSVDVNLSSQEIVEDYLNKWSSGYINDRENLAINSPLKDYGEKDEALINRVMAVTQVDKDTLKKYIDGHFLFMSAENKNGAILEEYLSIVLEKYGWIWCAGSTYRAIDFCFLEETTVLLQVKNKYNTENSSSSNIRTGTAIKKWNRLNRPRKKTGYDKPVPNWESLHEIVNANDALKKLLNEERYLKFIRENSTTELESLTN